jgi:hypothetical protein
MENNLAGSSPVKYIPRRSLEFYPYINLLGPEVRTYLDREKNAYKIIIIFHHEFRPGWPVSVSAVISSSSLLSGRPGRRLPFG